MSRLAIVTASIDTDRAADCFSSWLELATSPPTIYLVEQGAGVREWERYGAFYRCGTREILGVVPAFAKGLAQALHDGAEIIACLHDDLEIEEPGWDDKVKRFFTACPQAGLAGFGGAKGLGDADIYHAPYNPMQLARQRFLSNMRHAEAHGERQTVGERVACLDGFAQVARREFWEGYAAGSHSNPVLEGNLFALMQSWGIIHHAYDAALGCFAKRLGWQAWLLPLAVHHHGGLTAVADARYHEWARERFEVVDWKGDTVHGDSAIWTEAHRIVYEQFRDVLPIRT